MDEEPKFEYNNPWQPAIDYLSPAMGISGQAFQGAKNSAQQAQEDSALMVSATNALQGLFSGDGSGFNFKYVPPITVSPQVEKYESGKIDDGVPYLSGRQKTIARGGRLGAMAAAREFEEAHPGQKAPLSITDPEELKREAGRATASQRVPTSDSSGRGGGGRETSSTGLSGPAFLAAGYLDPVYKQALINKQQYGAGGGGATRTIDEEIALLRNQAAEAEDKKRKEEELRSLRNPRYSSPIIPTGIGW